MFTVSRMVGSLVVLTMLLAACGGASVSTVPETPPATATTPAAAGANNNASRGTLRLAYDVIWGGQDSLDPASPTPFYHAMRPLYDTLVRPGPDNRPVPSLATEWNVNDDATIWTFKLREGVVFHDGTSFTAADVAYTFKHLTAPDAASPMTQVLGMIERVEIRDEYTATFYLNQPHAELPVLFMPIFTGIIPEGSKETIGTTGIGTGPFKLEKLDPAGTTRLVANDSYWQGAPGLAAVDIIGIPDTDARLQALQAGQVDLIFELSARQAALLKGNNRLVVQQFLGGSWYGFAIDTQSPPFDDQRVRQAMRLVIDRQQMVDLLLVGGGTVSCDTPVWPGDPHRWNGSCPPNIEQARTLLAEAGYADGLEVTLHTSNALPQLIPLAEVYQQQAAQAGIKVTIKQEPAENYWVAVWGVEPFVTVFDIMLPADVVLNNYYRSNALFNVAHWDDPQTMQLLDTARTTLDPAERTLRYQEVQQYLFEQSVDIVPFHQNEIRAFNSAVSGIEPVNVSVDLTWHTITRTQE